MTTSKNTNMVTSENLEMFKSNAISKLSTARFLGYNGNPCISFENMLLVINDITSMYAYENEELETILFGVLLNKIKE